MASTKPPTDDTIRVLFIQNDPAVAEMYKLKLELDGYAVTIVTAGDDVAAAAASVMPELVFLDTQRREDRAMTTLRTLRATAEMETVPVIILSSVQAHELAASGFKPNVMDYVVQSDMTLSSLTTNIDEWAVAGQARRA
jgi:DNA-binding response OmpR family regulator